MFKSVAIATVSIWAVASVAHAQAYNRMVAFGDSLTDKGSLTVGAPQPPYFDGRFSNGPVWVEDLGFSNIAGYGGSTSGNADYALGGADTGLSNPPPGLGVQLQQYQAGGGVFGPHDLAIAWGGTNNLLTALNAADPTAVMPTAAQGAANDMGAMAATIGHAGAGTVLVPNLMDLGNAPGFDADAIGATSSQLLTSGVQTFNQALLTNLRTAASANPGTNYIYMDVNKLTSAINASPSQFGFTAGRCLSNAGVECASPSNYFYFDGLHPTAAGHALIADLADDYIYYGDRGAATALEAEDIQSSRQRAFDSAFGLLDGAGPDGSRATVQVDGERYDTTVRTLAPEAIGRDGDVRLVFDHSWSGQRLGLALDLGEGQVRAAPLSFNTKTYGGDLYYGWSGSSVWVKATAGLDRTSLDDIHRATGVGPIVEIGETHAWTWGGAAQAGLRFGVGALQVGPRMGLSYTRVTVDGYQETGASADYVYQNRSLDAVMLDGALRAETAVASRTSGFAEVGYERFLSYNGDPVVTSLADNTALPLSRDVGAPIQGQAFIAVGLSQSFGGRVTVQARYKGEFGDRTAQGGAVALRVSF